MRLIVNFFRHIIILLVAITGFVACDDKEGDVATSATLSMNDLSGTTTNCAVVLTARQGMKYTVRILSGDDWCRLSAGQIFMEGTFDEGESTKAIFLYVNENYTYNTRQAEIFVNFGNGDNYVLLLSQLSADPTVALEKEWAELPRCSVRENVDYRYYTVDKVGSKSNVRNYTICFDRTKKASLWVAYPLHSFYTSGNASRQDDFIAEPTIPTQYQPALGRSYKGWYDRGHQIAAADRKCSQEMMDQTFYWTNMTPQQSNFNQGLWGNLEGKVREERCADTLYVVTGAYFGGVRHSSIDATTNDNAGNACPIPTHYYKLMLRTKKGNTKKAISEITNASDLRAIGVFIQHFNTYVYNAETKKYYYDDVLKDEYFVSVNELERITGFDFFPMLPDEIEEEVEDQCDRGQWF